MRVRVQVEGLKELDAALGEFANSTAKGIMRRALIKAAKPMVDAAVRLAPDDPDTPPIDLHSSIVATSRMRNSVGRSEYSEVLKSGGSKGAAVAAMRAARRVATGGSTVTVFVGPSIPKSFSKAEARRHAIKANVQEFGSINQPAQPYMRPAFDGQVRAVLNNIATELRSEIDKSAKRAAARALRQKAGR